MNWGKEKASPQPFISTQLFLHFHHINYLYQSKIFNKLSLSNRTLHVSLVCFSIISYLLYVSMVSNYVYMWVGFVSLSYPLSYMFLWCQIICIWVGLFFYHIQSLVCSYGVKLHFYQTAGKPPFTLCNVKLV